MAVQPIVNVPEPRIHAYEALARFPPGGSPSPLHWFALADEFALRDRLELACLRAALELLGDLPRRHRGSASTSPARCCSTRAPSELLPGAPAPGRPDPRDDREQPAGGHPGAARADLAS